MQIPFELPNLDHLSDDERRTFQEAMAAHITVFSNLRIYNDTARRAEALRLAGLVHQALRLEKVCEQIYERLPEWAKW